jgi:hypothetical protein
MAQATDERSITESPGVTIRASSVRWNDGRVQEAGTPRVLDESEKKGSLTEQQHWV